VWNIIGYSGEDEFLDYVNQIASETYTKPEIALVSHGPQVSDVERL
jgi:hypothetical protein